MSEKDWADWFYDRKVASGQILDGPGWVKKLTITGNGTNALTADFYDGHSTEGTHKITLRVTSKDSQDINYEIPFRVEQGLYVEVDVTPDCVSVQYKKDKP